MADFSDHKDDGALRTIGEVASATGIKTHVLRYWEQQFPQLKPLKRSGGRRYYRPDDVALVERIDRLVNREGYTLRGARQAIEHGHVEEVADVEAPEPAAETSPEATVSPDILAALKSVRNRLAAALDG